jgi:lipopolysaccharide biosynthesis glycosyltransferase
MTIRPVAMAFDDNYVFPALVAIYSGRKFYDGNIKVVIGYDCQTLSTTSISLIERVCRQLAIEVSFVVVEIPDFLEGVGHISKMSWARMFLIEQLDHDFVWLDSDVILQSGWHQVLSDKNLAQSSGIAAALDTGIANVNPENSARIAAGNGYINAGVLVVKPSQIDAETRNAFISAMRRYAELRFQWMDQDIINFCYAGKTDTISPDYNVQVPIRRIRRLGGRILHFSSNAKPWLGVYRIAYFWSFAVRIWTGTAKELYKHLRSDESTRDEFRLLREQAARNPSFGNQNPRIGYRVAALAAAIIWGKRQGDLPRIDGRAVCKF